MRFSVMRMCPSHEQPDAGYADCGLREVGLPYADAGIRGALRTAYAPCTDLPAEFAKLLDRLR